MINWLVIEKLIENEQPHWCVKYILFFCAVGILVYYDFIFYFFKAEEQVIVHCRRYNHKCSEHLFFPEFQPCYHMKVLHLVLILCFKSDAIALAVFQLV